MPGMAPQSIDIIGHVLKVLDELVVPQVEAPGARAFADICSRLLHQVLIRETELEDLRRERDERAHAVTSRLAQALDTIACREPMHAPQDGALIQAFGTRLDELQDGESSAILEGMRQRVCIEKEFRERIDPEVALGMASLFTGGLVDRDRVKFGRTSAVGHGELDPPALQRCLRQHGPDWRHLRVLSLVRIQGGFSKQTLRLELADAPWAGTHFIIRRDRPKAYTGTTVATEFPVIQRMHADGLTVPEPLWLEPEGELGPAFMILRQARGRNDISGWQSQPQSVDRFLQDLARQMALLHRIDPARCGLEADPATPVSELIRRDIEHWSSLGGLQAPDAPPLLRAARTWLLRHVPRDSGVARVVHSDIGFHNLLTDGGEITALLDWEFCHLGDPQEDLNYVRAFVERVGSWSRFLEYYQRQGGEPFREPDSRFWKVWGSFRSGAGCAGALHAFNAGSFGSAAEAVTLAVSGLNFGPRFELDAAMVIVDPS